MFRLHARKFYIYSIVFTVSILFLLCFYISSTFAKENQVEVNYNNYVEAISTSQMRDYQKLAGGINTWCHRTKPTGIDQQTTIRMNRDTLYSIAIVDLSEGAEITLPDVGKRYISLAVQNKYGYINQVFYGGGTYTLNEEEVGSDYAMLFVRILVDAKDEADVQKANDFQKQYTIKAKSNKTFTGVDFEEKSFKQVNDALVALFTIAENTHGMFGTKDEVDPLYFIVGAAGGFGGLPEEHALYLNATPNIKAEHLTLTVKDVPVDGFWSITVYDAEGYMFTSENGNSSINNLIAEANEDGSYTINFVETIKGLPNSLAIKDGWNCVVRLYKPREEILSGTWRRPQLKVVK